LNNKRVNSNLFLIGKDDTLVGLVDQWSVLYLLIKILQSKDNNIKILKYKTALL
jgi:hypothetical protein